MVVQVCLIVIAVAFVTLVTGLIWISFQAQQSIQLLQTDVRSLSSEMKILLNKINKFVDSDLHAVSEDASHLLHNLNDLSSDIHNKSRSLNFLFQPLGFLNSKLSSGPSFEEPAQTQSALPQLLKWVASSTLLFKKTKELIKNYEKRT